MKPSELRYIQTVCSYQMLCYADLLPSSSLSLLHPKKTSYLRESHDPTRPGQDGHWWVATHHPPMADNKWVLVFSNVSLDNDISRARHRGVLPANGSPSPYMTSVVLSAYHSYHLPMMDKMGLHASVR